MVSESTLADRIMAAADRFAIAALEDLARNSESSRLERVGCRAALAALVAEACAPQSERVCRWPRDGRRFVTGWRIELADGQEVTDG